MVPVDGRAQTTTRYRRTDRRHSHDPSRPCVGLRGSEPEQRDDLPSEDLSRGETSLIDTDNLTSMSTPTGNILGLHGYIAPERMLRQMPASTLAAAYSLAVLTFRLLVLNPWERSRSGDRP